MRNLFFALLLFSGPSFGSTPESVTQISEIKTGENKGNWIAAAEFQFHTIGAYGTSWAGASLYRKIQQSWMVGIRPLSSLSSRKESSLGALVNYRLPDSTWAIENSLTRHQEYLARNEEWLLGIDLRKEFQFAAYRLSFATGLDGWDKLFFRNFISSRFSPRFGITAGMSF